MQLAITRSVPRTSPRFHPGFMARATIVKKTPKAELQISVYKRLRSSRPATNRSFGSANGSAVARLACGRSSIIGRRIAARRVEEIVMENLCRNAVLAGAVSLVFGIAAAGEIRVACYSDGNECEVTQDLAKRFETQNPDVKVAIDKVPYKAIVEQLPVQLAAGEGPDIARVTDLGGLSKYYLDITPYVKDPKYWEANFGQTLPWMRGSPTDKGIYGMMTQLTVTGPYVNKTLFEQANVPLPGPKATWDQWIDASRKVAKATQVPYAVAFDRSGHRFAGPAISMGAKYFDAKGNLA